MFSRGRRQLLTRSCVFPLFPASAAWSIVAGCADQPGRRIAFRRTRPADPRWPTASQWRALERSVGGRLIEVHSPFAACDASPRGTACAELAKAVRNPYYIGDQVALTQASGWADAWRCEPSVYAVAAQGTDDVVAAVKFASEHRLRLVVRGGGHSYQGTSCAPDSLLIWTRALQDVTLHESFVAEGCERAQPPQPAVTIGAGAIWMHVYDAVTTRGGRYVQGGGCATVGVAGLVQSGGFGSFSKNYGLAAGALLQAEIVTADGAARIANACTNPDLFWAIKGGGGGTFGVVTRLTLCTRELPAYFGAVRATIHARSNGSFRRLIDRFIGFYRERLFDRHWGESIRLGPGNALEIDMVFQGLDRRQAGAVWASFFDGVFASGNEFTMPSAPVFLEVPARHFWDPAYLTRIPGAIVADDRPGAPAQNLFWTADAGQAGQFLHAYDSLWLPASLLETPARGRCADALFAATRHWSVALHFNKGLAGAPDLALAEARDTAINPAALDAFALAIVAAEGAPAFGGMPGVEPDLDLAREHARRVDAAMRALRPLAPGGGSYVAESNFFNRSWQRAFWGNRHARLRAVKAAYDPEGLFFVHHGIGSEAWSADGFTRLDSRARG